MKLHIFFSVHERIFGAIANELQTHHGLGAVSGFVWGNDQRAYLDEKGFRVEPLTVFTTDILDKLDSTPADLAYLEGWERRCGVQLQHMIFAERHLLAKYSYEQILRLCELLFRRVEADFDSIRPDAYFSEDVACLTSYIHWAVAKDRGVKIVFMNNARFPGRVTTNSNPHQHWEQLDAIFPDTPAGTLSADDYAFADKFIQDFRDRPKPMAPGLMFRSRLGVASRFDLTRLHNLRAHWSHDRRNPTLVSPLDAVLNRGRRIVRNQYAELRGLLEKAPENERFLLYPLHLQPEATTLVLAPYYLNQLALIEDLAKSLPAGYRLYVKEHVISRGRWPLSFYRALRAIPGVRLISPSEHSISLLRRAAAVVVITGTMGWEALMLEKPVITFGHVFYNRHPFVHRGSAVAKQDWPELLRTAINDKRKDPELLRRFIACAYKATYPGVTGNPTSLPEIMEPENVQRLVRVVGSQIGLMPRLEGGLRVA
jgi:hypothetical protein